MIGEMESELGDDLIRGWGAQDCVWEIGHLLRGRGEKEGKQEEMGIFPRWEGGELSLKCSCVYVQYHL